MDPLGWLWQLPDRWAERLTWRHTIETWRVAVDAGWTALLADERGKVET